MKFNKLFLSVFVLIGVTLALTQNTVAGIAVAAAGGMYTTDMQTYRRLLAQKMQFVTWNVPLWAQFMGFIGGKKNMFEEQYKFATIKTIPKPTGKPIEVLQDFMYQGSGDMDIPVVYPLTGKGKSGSVSLIGTGERPKLAVQKVQINQERHAFLEQDSKMSKQILEHPFMVKQLMRRSSEYLGDWFNRWNAFQPYLALLTGSSENITKSAALGGLGVTRVSPMNLYQGGTGKVAFSTTHATYEASVASAVTGVTNTSTDYFGTNVIENMVYVAAHVHRVVPLVIEGMKLYPIAISDAQAKQLMADTKWNDRMKYAAERNLKGNPLFTGMVAGIYGGAVLFIDDTIPSFYVTIDGAGKFSAARSSVITDTTGVCVGTEDTTDGQADFMANPVDPGNVKPAILFGASAILCGVASDINFETEDYDFKQKIEVGADMIIGFKNGDIIDTDNYFNTAGNKRYDNRSCVVALTYSPSTADWSLA